MTDSEALQVWHDALTVPQYVRTLTGDLTRLKSFLYSTRAQHWSEPLASIEVRTSPLSPKDTLWLGPKGFMDKAA